MTTDRCPGCAAAVTPGAPWCTLCYTDLRVPETVPAAPAPAAALAAEPVAQPTAEYRPSMAASPQPTLDALPPDPILDAPITVAPPVAGVKLAGWPCLGCGAVMPMSESVCSSCHRPFLATDDMPALVVPGVGDLRSMDRAQKIAVMVVAAVLITGLLVAVAFIAGSVL